VTLVLQKARARPRTVTQCDIGSQESSRCAMKQSKDRDFDSTGSDGSRRDGC
jgi:hypothetical protein